ncbi:MAG TPA: GTPase HflX [Planctomycetota bacterium]|nr:GTPase HflX [Planctomycetota bacterium]
MHTTKRTASPQTAVVVKAILDKDRALEDPLAEICELARTAGLEVLDRFSQRLDRPRASTYLGKGKLQEVARRAAELDVDVVITDNDLSPGQERNLEKLCGRTIVDRSQLIMDIFAQRAETHQAKLQVELAQLRYMFPRLKRLWTHLSRYEGGIGMRGPGETQLETDKRLISRRIQRLQEELRDVERQKETTLAHRENEFVVALVGYTNAGKSTLLNRLTGSEELVEDKLFATLDTRVRRWPLTRSRHVLLTDTVGFIRDLPHHLVASFHATLAETRNANLLLHVVDASAKDAESKIRIVQSVLRDIGCEQETWLVLNKWDAVTTERMIEAQSLRFSPHVETRGEPSGVASNGASGGRGEPKSLRVSARSGEGLDELRERVLERLNRWSSHHHFAVPHGRESVLAYLRENAFVERTEYHDDAVHVWFDISPAREARLRHIFPEGFATSNGSASASQNDSAAIGTRVDE